MKKTWKQRYYEAKNSKRGKKAIKAAKGAGGTGIEAATGLVAAYVIPQLDRFALVNRYPWGKGAALALGGHFLKKSAKARPYASAAVVLGGYLIGESIRNRNTASVPASEPALPASTETQGWDVGFVQQRALSEPAAPDTGLVARLREMRAA